MRRQSYGLTSIMKRDGVYFGGMIGARALMYINRWSESWIDGYT